MSVLEQVPEDACAAVEFITLRLFDGRADYYDPPVIRQEKRFELITLLEILDDSCAACDAYAQFAEATAYLSETAPEIIRQNRYSILLSELEPLAQEIYRVTTRRQSRAFRGPRKRRPAEIEITAMAELAAEIRAIASSGALGFEADLAAPLDQLQTALAQKPVTVRAIREPAEAIAAACARAGHRARPVAERIAKLARILHEEPLPGNDA